MRKETQDICGLTKIINGKEWICIWPPHEGREGRNHHFKRNKASDIPEDSER